MTQVKGAPLIVKVEGRTFVFDSPTFEQEMFIGKHAVAAGLDEVSFQLSPDEQHLQDDVEKLLFDTYESGALFILIAGLLTEENVEWTKEEALKNAKLFQKTRDPEAKEGLRVALVRGLLLFFGTGVSSKQTSNISSSLAGDDASLRPRPNYSGANVMSPETAGEVFRSGRLPRSSAKSRSTSTKSRKTSSP